MILGLGAQLAYLNQLKNTARLKMAWCQKMKNLVVDLNCLKKINICGLDQEAWMLTLTVDCLFFVASVFVVCCICKHPNPRGQSASMMEKQNVKHHNIFKAPIVCI
jgi:hypothetical protein